MAGPLCPAIFFAWKIVVDIKSVFTYQGLNSKQHNPREKNMSNHEDIWEICGGIVPTVKLMRAHNAIALPEAAKLAAIELFKRQQVFSPDAIEIRNYLEAVE